MNTITNPRLIDKLMIMSLESTTKLTIEDIRKVLEIDEKIGVKTLNLLIPELKFRDLNYKGFRYVKISMRITADDYKKRLEEFKKLNNIVVGTN